MQESQLAAVIEPILAEHGLELDRLDVTPIGKRSVLRVTIDGDGPEGRGPLLDDIAAASSAIVPVVIVFIIGNKQFVKGITAGAVKG